MGTVELLTREDIKAMCKCGYTVACDIFKNVYASIPADKRIKQHKRAVPLSYVKDYIDPPKAEVTPA